MVWTRYQQGLGVLLVVAATATFLTGTWPNHIQVHRGPTERSKTFNHPYLLVLCMFMGQLLCLPVFYLVKRFHSMRGSHMEGANSSFCWLVFLPSTLLDVFGTSLLYVAQNLTISSSLKMFNGTRVIFTGLLSVAFLGRYIRGYMWMGLLLIVVALMTVGVGDAIYNDPAEQFSDKNAVVAGDLLLVMAQAVVAGQMVYTEKVVLHNTVHPLMAVGIEGLFGVLIMAPLLACMSLIHHASPPFTTNPDGTLENTREAFSQMKHNYVIIIVLIGNMISAGVYNFASCSILKELCATTSMVVGSLANLFIWVTAVGLAWDIHDWRALIIQTGGFLLLLIGVCIYNDVLFHPFLKRHGCMSSEPEQPDPDAFVPRRDPTIGGPSMRTRRRNGDEEAQPLLAPHADTHND